MLSAVDWISAEKRASFLPNWLFSRKVGLVPNLLAS